MSTAGVHRDAAVSTNVTAVPRRLVPTSPEERERECAAGDPNGAPVSPQLPGEISTPLGWEDM